MVKKIVTRRGKEASAPKVEVSTQEEKIDAAQKPKKSCYFCKNKQTPLYTDTASLKKFTTDRGKIVPKLRSGACAKHQRFLTKHIKYARHLALLPFTPKI